MAWAGTLSEWALLGLLVLLPWHRSLATLAMVVFAGSALLQPGTFRWKPFGPVLALWLLTAAGLLWSTQTEYGFNLLIRQLPMFVIPLAFSKLSGFSVRFLQNATWSFSLSLLVASLSALCLGYLDFQSTGEYKSLFYHDLSGKVGLSALYFSLFLVMASALLIHQIFRSTSTKITILSASILLLFFLGMLVLLSARASVLAWLFLVFLGLIWFWKNPRSWFIKVSIPVVLLMGIGAVATIPLLRERFQEAINFENRFSLSGFGGGTSFRLAKWESAWNCIKAEPLFGYGTGDVQLTLDQQYKAEGKFQLLDYNAHNQYLQTWLGLGIPGLFLLFASFWTLIHYSKDRFLAIAFAGIWGICIFTESMMQTQKGILFFAVFYGLLLSIEKAVPGHLPKSSHRSPGQ
jgi:O-antigen ligase